MKQCKAHLLITLHQHDELRTPPLCRLKRKQIGQSLNRFGDVRAELSERCTRFRSHAVDAPPPDPRGESRIRQERQQRESERPGSDRQGRQHRARHERRDEGRGNRVSEEILDRFHILRREREQISRPPFQQIGRGERFELAVEIDAHLGEQAIRHLVGKPGFEPVQQACQRRDDQQRDDERLRPVPVLHRRDHQRAHHADADERSDASDAQGDHQCQLPPPRTDERHERDDRISPVDLRRVGVDVAHFDALLIARFVHARTGVIRMFDRVERDLGIGNVIVLSGRGLCTHEPAIRAIAAHELFMAPAFDDMPALEHENAIGADHARQPVGENQRRAFRHKAIERLLDHGLVLCIDR